MTAITIALVILTAVMVLQRNEYVRELLGGEPRFELVRDEAVVEPNTVTMLDVLSNDIGVGPEDVDRLFIVTQPPCGRASTKDGRVEFVANERCSGPQSFSYAISGRGDGATGEVLAMVRIEAPLPGQVAPGAQRDIPAPAPAAARSDAPRGDADPAVLAAQPDGTGERVLVPSVPRPQAGEPSPLTDPGARQSPAAIAGLTVGDSGERPETSVAEPAMPAGGAALGADPRPAPHESADPARTMAGEGATTDPATAFPSGSNASAGSDTAGISRQAPSAIGGGGAPDLPTDEPTVALGALLGQGGNAVAAVNTTPPGELAASRPAAPVPDPQPSAIESIRQQCSAPATITLDIRPGGLTGVNVHSPCDALTVARVAYDGLEFAFQLDGIGLGETVVPGLQPASQAELELDSGNGVSFDLAFDDTENLDRVAIVWEAPVTLGLHAFEFGAAPGAAGHVSPDRPRSFDEVRRGGGGFLTEWQAVKGYGQNVSLYTYWRRPGGPRGVVDLKLDFISRAPAGTPETCGGGAQAAPDFRVIRSLAGRLQPAERRRIAALDCAAVPSADRLIGDAVDDILITQR